MKLKLFACNRLWREWALAAALSKHEVQLCLLSPQQIRGPQLPDMLQHSAGDCDLILIGAGACANEENRLAHLLIDTPVVLPRAADCTALLVGGRRRYETLFEEMEGNIAWQLPDHAAVDCAACSGCSRGGRVVRLRAPVGPRTQALGRCHLELVGDLKWFEQALAGPWEDEETFTWLPGRR